MFGKGGGNFFVPIFVIYGIPFHQAASTSLFILMISGLTMLIVFNRKTLIDWKTGLSVIAFSSTGAFIGGFISSSIPVIYLKINFSVFSIISAYFLYKSNKNSSNINFGPIWKRKLGIEEYNFPVAIVLPLVFIVGIFAGMIGISGGALIVPILIVLGNLPLRIAFATNSLNILFSSTAGFLGHGISNHIHWKFAITMAIFVLIGSAIGSMMSTKVNAELLKIFFVIILVIAAFMIYF